MILKTLPVIRLPYPVIRYLYFIVLVSLIMGHFSSCLTKKEKNAISGAEVKIENIMLSISVNPAYQKVGLLKLSEYGLFRLPLNALEPSVPMLPYDLNTPLFTDYASKLRFIYIPEGAEIFYREKDVLEFPEGTVLIKNFFYNTSQLVGDAPGKILETRLLIKQEGKWIALPYIWNEEQTDAFLEITGGTIPVQLTGMDQPFEYRVPTMLQCKSCHEYNAEIVPIGPVVRQLNKNYEYENGRQNQVEKLIELGWLVDHPERSHWSKLAQWDMTESGDLDARARAYLEINCGHCHREGGPGKNSGLDLTLYSANAHTLGIMKSPVAAGAGSGGLRYDIVPGKPDQSILVFRMTSLDPGIMMPELGRSLVHREGVELIEKWIHSLN